MSRELQEAFEILGHLAEDSTALQHRAADIDDDLLSRHVQRIRTAVVMAGDRIARLLELDRNTTATLDAHLDSEHVEGRRGG